MATTWTKELQDKAGPDGGLAPSDLTARLEAAERQILELRRRMAIFDHWHNTMHSPWYMHLWWWILGYRMLSLGTWYRAPWNRSARKYE